MLRHYAHVLEAIGLRISAARLATLGEQQDLDSFLATGDDELTRLDGEGSRFEVGRVGFVGHRIASVPRPQLLGGGEGTYFDGLHAGCLAALQRGELTSLAATDFEEGQGATKGADSWLTLDDGRILGWTQANAWSRHGVSARHGGV